MAASKYCPKRTLEGAKYTLAVPTYAAEAGLKSFADIAKFKDQLGGKIFGIEPGNDGNLLIDGMIKSNQFGLGEFKMVESSEAGMLVQLQRAVKKNEPAVFLGWAPHPMNTQFDITYLEGGDDVFGPDFGAAKVYTVVPPDYEARCANVGKLLNNLQFTVEIESQLMEKVLDKREPDRSRQRVDQSQPGDPRSVAGRRYHLRRPGRRCSGEKTPRPVSHNAPPPLPAGGAVSSST